MISSKRVTEIFSDCFYLKEEIIEGKPITKPMYVEGIICKFGFNPEKIKKHSEEIKGIINELPEKFKEGWSFINLCETKDGEQWTGSQQQSEQLMVLGLATGDIVYCIPKEMWFMFPGGVPYIRVVEKTNKEEL